MDLRRWWPNNAQAFVPSSSNSILIYKNNQKYSYPSHNTAKQGSLHLLKIQVSKTSNVYSTHRHRSKFILLTLFHSNHCCRLPNQIQETYEAILEAVKDMDEDRESVYFAMEYSNTFVSLLTEMVLVWAGGQL